MEGDLPVKTVNHNPVKESRALSFLYHTIPGRVVLKLAASRPVSRLARRCMDSRASRALIPGFIRKNGIDMSEYQHEDYACFNDFFCRRVRPELRPICLDPDALVAPCDGLLTAWPIHGGTVLPIKQSRYTISELLGGDPAATRFDGGVCLVFRLCVNHYHRYCYPDDGVKGKNVFIPGQLHTVRPIALSALPVFIRNCREYTLMETEHFGTIAQIEVGAMLVGRIDNHHGAGPIVRGQEKGMFRYGGSTIVVLIGPGRASIDPAILSASARGIETPVVMGQPIGQAVHAS